MSELGQVLRQAREEKGITLEEIQKVTKIQRRYLEAIERGHYHILPGHFYARAFIKSYAEAVGLDANSILSHFQSELPAQPPQESMERLRRRRAAVARQPLRAGKWVMQTLLVLFVVLVIGVIYTAFVNRNGLDMPTIPGNTQGAGEDFVTTPGSDAPGLSVEPGSEDGTGSTPGSEAGKETEQPSALPAEPVLTLVEQKGKTNHYVLANAEQITITYRMSKGRCWLEAYEKPGGKPLEPGKTFQQGEEKTYTFSDSAYVQVGHPPAVEIFVNGTPVDVSQFKGSPSYMSVTLARQ
ncbi:MAG: helix-turn-helix domain-containing protein [Brevibacillus sp.]|nr:helix-turn-helix domain-containing protein [Brevibacillus sp.]